MKIREFNPCDSAASEASCLMSIHQQDRLNLHVVFVPGLLSPPGLMKPITNAFSNRAAKATLWQHPTRTGPMSRNITALSGYLNQLASDRMPLALVGHSFGDWVIRHVLDSLTENPTHIVSIGPVVHPPRGIRLARKIAGRRYAELNLLADHETLANPIELPPMVRHLVLWPSIDFWFRRGPYGSPQTLQRTIFGTHDSLLFQPNVRRLMDQFFRSQTVDGQPHREIRTRFDPMTVPEAAISPSTMSKVDYATTVSKQLEPTSCPFSFEFASDNVCSCTTSD
jgi:pimeloyl-ACP methyl ester carboxylesterase